MASISIDSVRKNYPGKTDREAAAAIASEDPSIVIIVRYKLTRDGEYSNFGLCYSRDEAETYVSNDGIGIHGVDNIYLRQPPRKDPALILAVEDGDTEKVRNMIHDGVDVNTKFKDTWSTKTALTVAALKGHTDIVKLLIEKGFDLNTNVGNEGKALDVALDNAASFGYTDIVNLLIEKGADVNYINSAGGSVLLGAARDGHTETVKYLIEKGVDINDIDEVFQNAADAGHTETVKYLIEKGADINTKTESGWTALMSAASKGWTDTLKLLIDNGTDINAKSKDGRTALIVAINTEIEQLLKQAGAK